MNKISCTKLQLPPEPLTRGLPPPDPRSLCPQLNLLNPPPKKIPGYATIPQGRRSPLTNSTSYRWSCGCTGLYWNNTRTSPATMTLFLRKTLTSRDSVIMSYRYTMMSRVFHGCNLKSPGNLSVVSAVRVPKHLTAVHMTGPRTNNWTRDTVRFNYNTHKFSSLLVARQVLWRRVVM